MNVEQTLVRPPIRPSFTGNRAAFRTIEAFSSSLVDVYQPKTSPAAVAGVH